MPTGLHKSDVERIGHHVQVDRRSVPCKTVAAHVAFARGHEPGALERSHHLAHTRRVRTDILGQSLAGNDVRLMVQIHQRVHRNNEIAVHDAAPSTTNQLFHFFIQ